MFRKIVLFPMFKNKDAVLVQQLVLKDNVGDGGKFGKRVRRICENKVELLATTLEKPEHISTDKNVVPCVNLSHTFRYEACVVAIFLHAYHLSASPREQFEGDAARTREQIECRGVFPAYVLVQDVEDVFFRKVGGGSGFERVRNVETSAFIFSRDDSHGVW